MQQDEQTRDAAARAAEHAGRAAASAGLATGAAAEALSGVAAAVADAAVEGGRGVLSAVRGGAELLPTPEVLEGVLEDALDRGAEAWDALRGRRRSPRRWSAATGGALVGAAAAVAVTVLVRRLSTKDAPGAQDPETVQAVVDAAPVLPSAPAVAPSGAVDEDGEAVQA